MSILDDLRKSSDVEDSTEEPIELKSTVSMLESLIEDYENYQEKKNKEA